MGNQKEPKGPQSDNNEESSPYSMALRQLSDVAKILDRTTFLILQTQCLRTPE